MTINLINPAEAGGGGGGGKKEERSLGLDVFLV